MNWKKVVLALIFADFAILTGYGFYQHGFVGLFQTALSTWAGIQVAVDLVLALCFACFWMYKDAKERGMNPVPFVALTMTTGSFGLLLYALMRKEAPAEAPNKPEAAGGVLSPA